MDKKNARAETLHRLPDRESSVPRIKPDLPPETLTEIRNICGKLTAGKGLIVLSSCSGEPDKSLVVVAIAATLRRDLYPVDLAAVVSKYIGETEKNLDKVFEAAEQSGAILFFDEADALFGQRTEVKDSHDRYTNIETGYLLRRMQEHQALAILASNSRHAIDAAQERGIPVIHYPPLNKK